MVAQDGRRASAGVPEPSRRRSLPLAAVPGPPTARRAALALAAIAFVCAVLGACSGSSESPARADEACPLFGRLDATAAGLEQADVADPDAFEQALEAAVTAYSATVADLREVTPDELHDDLERLEAAVGQYDFDEAARVKTALDDYVERECPSLTTTTVPTTLVPVTPSTATPLPSAQE